MKKEAGQSDLLAEIRLTPPRRARRRMAGLVIPWMLSRRILRWRLAPPLPRPLPPLPPIQGASVTVVQKLQDATRLQEVDDAGAGRIGEGGEDLRPVMFIDADGELKWDRVVRGSELDGRVCEWMEFGVGGMRAYEDLKFALDHRASSQITKLRTHHFQV